MIFFFRSINYGIKEIILNSKIFSIIFVISVIFVLVFSYLFDLLIAKFQFSGFLFDLYIHQKFMNFPLKIWIVSTTSCFSYIYFKGISTLATIEEYENFFTSIGIKNTNGEGIKIIGEEIKKNQLTKIKIKLSGNSIEKIRNSFNELGSMFSKVVVKAELEDNPDYAIIYFEKEKLPSSYSFSSVREKIEKTPNTFIVGKTREEGLVTANIADLPHLLISGTTGFGKSNYFNSVLASLISNSNAKFYLIDLKEGVEFMDYQALPQVTVIDELKKASITLQEVYSEMKKRSNWMKKNRLKKIIPEEHGIPRIILGIDECSLLFERVTKTDPNFNSIFEARQNLERISKLGRSAAINIIAATQKVDRNSISTQIQENFSGRVSFKSNTIESASRIIRGKSSRFLTIPGRGLWQFNGDAVEFQAPEFKESDIRFLKKKTLESKETDESITNWSRIESTKRNCKEQKDDKK